MSSILGNIFIDIPVKKLAEITYNLRKIFFLLKDSNEEIFISGDCVAIKYYKLGIIFSKETENSEELFFVLNNENY
ncbi:MAG: hypothetical protein LBU14_05935 [Candidatus Peribacteria bacterium]|jgi:hypothetical protein|nr:hypothetical protein [Candidatus Peribacteria bacterium]